jgi:hypothetical protein
MFSVSPSLTQRFSPLSVDSGLLPPGMTAPRKFSPMKRSIFLMSSDL